MTQTVSKTHCVTKHGLKFQMLLPLPPESQDCKHQEVPPHPLIQCGESSQALCILSHIPALLLPSAQYLTSLANKCSLNSESHFLYRPPNLDTLSLEVGRDVFRVQCLADEVHSYLPKASCHSGGRSSGLTPSFCFLAVFEFSSSLSLCFIYLLLNLIFCNQDVVFLLSQRPL